MARKRKQAVSLAAITVCLPLLLGCGLVDLVIPESQITTEMDRLKEREEQVNPGGVQEHPAPEGTNEIVTFTYDGEGPSYHGALLGNTVYYIDYNTGAVTANESEPFEEPAGDTQTRRGTDTVKFDGAYDAAAKTISGTLTVKTKGTSSGGESSDSTIEYTMVGQLEAQLQGDTWSGTVNGTSTLTQTWAEGELAPSDTPGTSTWTITSKTREVI